MDGVSFVLPVYNGERHLGNVLAAILDECAESDAPVEVLVIDDRSDDGSRAVAERIAREHDNVHLLDAAGRGAAEALNLGIDAARFAMIAQVDQDVLLLPGWLAALRGRIEEDERICAVGGSFVADERDGWWAMVAELDLARRYADLPASGTDHVCTGNTLYRTRLLREVGAFDTALGYGYDNDLSYRLVKAGYRLLIEPSAAAVHRWPASLGGYLRQQYGQGYGRLDLVSKHPDRVAGDSVSGPWMMLHVAGMLAALLLLLLAAATAIAGGSALIPATLSAGLLALLAGERLVAGIRAGHRPGVVLGLLFAHLLRDVAWTAAVIVWLARRATGARPEPAHSMPRRGGR